ncbi:hypothetical protein D9619_003293 [Psilocybe cf. subviscida]|uniref:Uncharacterized protein n=1 Tax=Psilocybe cf. subviscida TaxID=2480587 RepID=A0A8H5AWM5_9AGAR|nr:hypothetical protein D9619_003293 [Psilocybe cf. subviscida]
MTVSNRDRLRILIALSILKHTPPDQTPFVYAMHLRSTYTVSTVSVDTLWKNHALKLGQELLSLKARCDSDGGYEDLLSAQLQKQSDEKEQAAVTAESTLSEPPKKKAKKKAVDESSEPKEPHIPVVNQKSVKMKEMIDQLYAGKAPKLFVLVDQLITLTTAQARPSFSMSVFQQASYKIVNSISSAFDLIVKQNSGFHVLDILSTILCTTLEEALPLANSRDTLSVPQLLSRPSFELLDHTLLQILIPAVKSFFSVTLRNLEQLAQKPTSPAKKDRSNVNRDHPASHAGDFSVVDGRPATLAFLQSVLTSIYRISIGPSHFNEASTSKKGSRQRVSLNQQRLNMLMDFDLIRHSFMLETIRNLVYLLVEHGPKEATGKYRPTRHDRMLILVLNESLWCTCSVLHLALGFPVEDQLISTGPEGNCDPAIWLEYKRRLELLKSATIKLFTWLLSATPNAQTPTHLTVDLDNGPASPGGLCVEGKSSFMFDLCIQVRYLPAPTFLKPLILDLFLTS